MSVLGRDLEHRLEPELVELHAPAARALVVGLVDRQETGTAGLAQLARDRLVARDQPFAAVDQQHQQIGAGDRALPLLDDQLVQRILARAVQPAGIEQLERRCRATTTGRASASRVVPAIGATIARRVPVIRLKSVDFPTFGRPTSTTEGGLRAIQ